MTDAEDIGKNNNKSRNSNDNISTNKENHTTTTTFFDAVAPPPKSSASASNSSSNITVTPTTTTKTKTLQRKLPSSSSSSGDTTIHVHDDDDDDNDDDDRKSDDPQGKELPSAQQKQKKVDNSMMETKMMNKKKKLSESGSESKKSLPLLLLNPQLKSPPIYESPKQQHPHHHHKKVVTSSSTTMTKETKTMTILPSQSQLQVQVGLQQPKVQVQLDDNDDNRVIYDSTTITTASTAAGERCEFEDCGRESYSSSRCGTATSVTFNNNNYNNRGETSNRNFVEHSLPPPQQAPAPVIFSIQYSGGVNDNNNTKRLPLPRFNCDICNYPWGESGRCNNVLACGIRCKRRAEEQKINDKMQKVREEKKRETAERKRKETAQAYARNNRDAAAAASTCNFLSGDDDAGDDDADADHDDHVALSADDAVHAAALGAAAISSSSGGSGGNGGHLKGAMRQRRLSMNRASAKARRSHKKCLLSSLTTPAPSESAVRPNNQDVLLGLGKPVRNHNGNRKMAGLIVQYRRQYNESKNGQKGAIVEEILGILSTDGGRFLRRYNEDSTGWTEVPQQVAFKKVCDAFRSQGKIAKAEAERRNEKIQDDKRAKKAEVVAERKEKKRKRVEEKEQKEQEVVAERKEKKSKRAEEKEQKEQEVVAERKEKKRKRVEEKEQKKQDVAAERKKMKMAQALAKKILQEQKEQDKSEQKAPFNSNNKKRSSDNITKASNETTTTTTTTTNAYSLIEKTPTQRLETGYRQLTPKQTTELLVVLRKISNVKNAFLGHSFVTKDTTSRALKYLLSAIRHGLMHYPDTCHPKVVQWNGVSKFCINSHIPLLIALFMALRNDDDNHKFNSEEWNKIHTEVMYGCQYAIDRKRREKGNVGCNSNPLTGSTIEKTGEVDKDGKLVWKRIDARPKFLNNANIRNTSHQFTGGGTGSAYITRTVDGVSIVWPEFNDIITVQAITDLGKSLMNHLSITDHSVVGKLLEMRHWHSMNYFGHRPVGIYWFHKDGGTLSSMTNDEMESVASKGAQWIKSTAQYK